MCYICAIQYYQVCCANASTVRAVTHTLCTRKADNAKGADGVCQTQRSGQCEALNVKLVKGAWNAAYLEELTSFPFGSHDDQVDALTYGLIEIHRVAGGLEVKEEAAA